MSEALINFGGLIDYTGLGAAIVEDPENEAPNQRWKTSARKVDWQAFFIMLIDQGMSQKDISRLTGMPLVSVNAVINGRSNFMYGDYVMALLGLFTMNIGPDVPLLGDYHACLDRGDDD